MLPRPHRLSPVAACVLALWLSAGLGGAAETYQPGVDVRLYDVGQGIEATPRLLDGQAPNVAKVVPQPDLLDTRGDFGALQDQFLSVLTGRLEVPAEGDYELRLTSDDGSLLWLNDQLVIDHDGLHGPESKSLGLYLLKGFYRFEIQHFENGGGAMVKLDWKRPGDADFGAIPASLLSCRSDLERVTAEGRKQVAPREPGPGSRVGAPLGGVHPACTLTTVRPDTYQPHVRGLAVLPDGRLAVLTREGELDLVSGVGAAAHVEQVLDGLTEAEGLAAAGDRLVVQQPSRLICVWADGKRIDPPQELARLDGPQWQGKMLHVGPALVGDRLWSVAARADDAGAERAQLARVAPSGGQLEVSEEALYVPLALAVAGDGCAWALDTAGGDGPGARLVRIDARAGDKPTVTTVAWLVGGEVVGRPSDLAVAEGQVFVGDQTQGGVRRVFIDEVNGRPQGVVFRFTQGLECGVSRLCFGPDGSLFIGGDGATPETSQLGKRNYGLQRLRQNGDEPFELLAVRARSNGLELQFSQPLRGLDGWDPGAYRLWQFDVDPVEPTVRKDEKRLAVESATVSGDKRTVFLEVPDLQAGHVVYLRTSAALGSDAGPLWNGEAWLTLNALPQHQPGTVLPAPEGSRPNTLTVAEREAGWQLLFDGKSTGAWRGFRRQDFPAGGWLAEDGCLKCLGGRGGDIVTKDEYQDFELVIDWRCSRGANSGIMWRVSEEISPSWHTGPEIQILDDANEQAPGRFAGGSCYELYPPQNRVYYPAGEWNSLRFVLRGNHGEQWLNGVKVVEFEIGSDDWNRRLAASKFKDMPRFAREPKGRLCLQDHGHEVWFRNIKVRALPAE